MTTETTVEQSANGPVGAVTDEQLIAMLADRARGDGLKLTGQGGVGVGARGLINSARGCGGLPP